MASTEQNINKNTMILYDKKIWNSPLSPVVTELREKYVNALKPNEKEKIKQLKSRFGNELAHQPDYFFIKWLRARKWDLTAAETMLRADLKFREEYKVDTIQHSFTPPEVCLKYIPLGLVGQDKDGCPLFIFPFGNMDIPGLLNSVTLSEVISFFAYACEYTEVLKSHLTEKHGKVISCQIAIFDMDNFRIKEFISKQGYELASTLLKRLEGNYPEVLKKGIIINAPKIFSLFWAMMKPFLSEVTKNKMEIYGKDGWKEALLEIADPDQLPKHWGGTMVDEVDGNPYCTSKVVMGGKIPESYYMQKNRKDTLGSDMKVTTAPRQGKCTVDVKVDTPKSKLVWSFQTEDHDIGFGITYNNDNENGCNLEDTENFLIPIERVKCQDTPETGILICEKAGIYTLVFDNSYSWYRGKKVYYEVHVE